MFHFEVFLILMKVFSLKVILRKSPIKYFFQKTPQMIFYLFKTIY